MADGLPSGLLEACVIVGLSHDKLKELSQVNGSPLPQFDPEVIQVCAPPFVFNVSEPAVGNFSQTQLRCSFIKKKTDRPVINTGNPKDKITEDVSVPKDLDLVALPHLCFPGGLQVTREQKVEQFHFLVFTDVFGNQSYGVVLQYYRSIQEGMLYLNGHQSPQLYTAYAICVISKHPYYNTLKDCLSSLLGQLKICQMTNMEEQVKEFSAKLALVPVPPPGQLHVMFTLQPLTIVLPSKEDKNHPVIDLDLHLPFLCFNSRELLQIIASILTEQRMVFFSSDWSKLTLIAECFMLYIWPLRWQHPLVPILSRQMLDFIMAPTAFLMGCHISHYEEVAMEADDLILINIDEGTVSCSRCHYINVPDTPQAAAQSFKSRRKGLQLHYDLEVVHQSICGDLNELRMQRRLWQHRLNLEIQNVSLELIVNMFRDVRDYLSYEHRVFNTDEFLKTREPEDQPFYKKVVETQIFHSFLKERLNGKMDTFTRMERSIRTDDQNRLKRSVDYSRRPTTKVMLLRGDSSENGLTKRLSTSLADLDDVKRLSVLRQMPPTKIIPKMSLITPARPVKIFQLPDLPTPFTYPNVCHYFGALILQLKKAISATPPDDSSLLARYFYLRGLINMLNSEHLDALSDFQNLYKTDIEIFPGELVKTLVDSLHIEERVQALKRSELKRLICQVKNNEKSEHMESDDHVKKFQLPKTPMQPEEFVKYTQESGIVRDVATTQRLFEALTVDGQKQIDPEKFRAFYTFWKETEAVAQEVLLPADVLECLDNNECVYKLSSSVKTSYGVGKIAMTQKRLFLLTTGKPGYVEITKFRDIEEVKISIAPFLLLKVQSLKIKNSLRKEIFEANLKSESELWSLMIKEMWAGRMMADNHKDPQYVQQALTNVLLMDAVVGCLQTQKAVYAASKLAYYEKLRQEVPMIIPRPTAETLKHKINPSQNMSNPQAVDVLLYTPGQLTFCESDVDRNPKLWCALSCGKVVVFDAVSWSLKQNCIHLGNSRLNCMMGLGQEQVWIGSQDSVIYIINTHSMLCHKQLTEHHREVTDFALEKLSPENRLSQAQVYSCSADGTVIVWDVPSLKVKRQFHLPCDRLQSIQVHNDALWCGARDCVMKLTLNGAVLHKISLPDHMKTTASAFSRVTLLMERREIWTSFTESAELCIWDSGDPIKPPKQVTLPNCSEVTCMIRVKKQVWIGCSGGSGLSKVVGKIFVLDSESLEVEKELEAHEDIVQTLFSAEDRYILSGSAKLDGKIAIWRVD
ncbi:DENN domain-containing protein 3 isoform X1 [Megalobrama amblycephala]|uniref:DENN domain-containing protein 3 isoform X1 n=1 Tax=Megalobrama amblycephala TaxID=75352 RepID=UPI0020144B9D|nr:DENN domain-containing protein 3 isoform X1 [Megalobrama amblycephala]XP_048008142.1 DENN domain-containing protein 3 isoform X1 [Megalobrama amblycephala]XP_048008143.1 DENN domain-containing protein 3 isoform X1 [Megalobrama amblycephala]XP_048008144.1 DENN domain-containing protein 3 isoform X1 [Megalobrama amblycephala]